MRLHPGLRLEERSFPCFPIYKNIFIHIVLDTAGALFSGPRTSAFHIYVLVVVMGSGGSFCFGPCAMRKL